MLDILNGRLNFGVGRALFPNILKVSGVDRHESVRHEESLEIARQAWTQDTFSYQGKFGRSLPACA
jgi:alkanesulfonate monooxygenase SsuD/methylene tetrahydromethanopterin reductase-like flavin-dependent oxidoreductase (luciferase family)